MNKNIPCLQRKSNLYAVIALVIAIYGCGNGYSETKNAAGVKTVAQKKDTAIETTPAIQPLDTAAKGFGVNHVRGLGVRWGIHR